MNNPYQAPQSNLETVQPSKGTTPRFTFQVGEDEIIAECSLTTGGERIYLNGELLFSKLNWRFKGVHNLYLHGEDYQVVISAKSLVKPIRYCTLEKDGVVLKKYRSESKPKQIYFVIALLLIFVEAIISDVLAVEWGLPQWGVVGSMIFFCIVLCTGMYYSQKNGSVKVFEET